MKRLMAPDFHRTTSTSQAVATHIRKWKSLREDFRGSCGLITLGDAMDSLSPEVSKLEIYNLTIRKYLERKFRGEVTHEIASETSQKFKKHPLPKLRKKLGVAITYDLIESIKLARVQHEDVYDRLETFADLRLKESWFKSAKSRIVSFSGVLILTQIFDFAVIHSNMSDLARFVSHTTLLISLFPIAYMIGVAFRQYKILKDVLPELRRSLGKDE